MRALLLAVLLLLPLSAVADRQLYLHLGSEHLIGKGCDDGRPYNETNGGVGLVIDLYDEWAAEVGGYHNSCRTTSLYVAAAKRVHESEHLTVRIGAIVASGYDPALASPVMTLESGAVRVTVTPGVIGLSLRLANW